MPQSALHFTVLVLQNWPWDLLYQFPLAHRTPFSRRSELGGLELADTVELCPLFDFLHGNINSFLPGPLPKLGVWSNTRHLDCHANCTAAAQSLHRRNKKVLLYIKAADLSARIMVTAGSAT